jgi:hypothetical protein
MSSGLQHKMYNFEVPPPSGVWEKIAAELDESELSNKFPSTLHNIKITPPVHVWQSIAVALDEPALVNDYAAKLGGIEMAPPAAAWNKIKTSLDAEHEAAIPEHRRFAPFLKYAAAAVVIGFLAWGGISLSGNKKSSNNTLVKSQTTVPAANPTTNNTAIFTDEDMAVTDIAASMEEARNDAALEASKKTFAKLDATVTRSKIKNAANFFFVADDYEPAGTRGFLMEEQETPSMDVSNRYVMLMTPDGNIIRMSKKLKELVCCVSGELQDKDCVDQMKKWRDILGNPSINHSSNSFIDILSLMDCMQDN